MRQQAAHTLQLMPNEHRSTFEQEAVPTKNALNTPHPALEGYQSRFLPAKTPAWRVVEQERNFAGQRPAVERLIREKHKRDKDAAERSERPVGTAAASLDRVLIGGLDDELRALNHVHAHLSPVLRLQAVARGAKSRHDVRNLRKHHRAAAVVQKRQRRRQEAKEAEASVGAAAGAAGDASSTASPSGEAGDEPSPTPPMSSEEAARSIQARARGM